MFKWLRKIFMEESKDTQISNDISAQITETNINNEIKDVVSTDNVVQTIPAVKPIVKKRFQVEIYDKITYGDPPMEQVKLEKVHYDKPVIIEASSKKDLQDFAERLALCKQTFKIVSVLNDVPSQQMQQAKYTIPQNNVNIQHATSQQPIIPKEQIPVVKQKPKFYKIGDIEIKDDNGKIYQKQWLKLTDDEMSNFRIVSNKTNAIVKLNDKSIEMKKWILVETVENNNINLEEYI